MQTNLGKLTDDWRGIDTIVLYGAGTVSKICEDLFRKINLKIACVIDRDVNKQGRVWNDAPIVSFEEAKNIIRDKKLVVMTAHAAFNDISLFLEKQGFAQYRDFCEIGQFICEWFWNEKHMNCVYHMDMTVTTRCTLNCVNCNMFIPYHKEHFSYTFEELKNNIDLFFERIDYVAYFGLIGGEPLLNPVLKDVIVYLEENYKEQFGHISFTANGTVMPPDELLKVIQKYNVHIFVSDYSKTIPYQEKIRQLEKRLKEYEITYDIKPDLIWCDFGFPEHPYNCNEQQLQEHLASCRPEWNGLNDGKFYYCNVSWSAEKSGSFKLAPADYIDLKSINPEDKEACHSIVELSRGTCSFCRVCGGCGRDNTNYVDVGVQKKGSNM